MLVMRPQGRKHNISQHEIDGCHDRDNEQGMERERQERIEDGVAHRLDGTDEEDGGQHNQPATDGIHRDSVRGGRPATSTDAARPTRSGSNMRRKTASRPDSGWLS